MIRRRGWRLRSFSPSTTIFLWSLWSRYPSDQGHVSPFSGQTSQELRDICPRCRHLFTQQLCGFPAWGCQSSSCATMVSLASRSNNIQRDKERAGITKMHAAGWEPGRRESRRFPGIPKLINKTGELTPTNPVGLSAVGSMHHQSPTSTYNRRRRHSLRRYGHQLKKKKSPRGSVELFRLADNKVDWGSPALPLQRGSKSHVALVFGPDTLDSRCYRGLGFRPCT